MLSNSDKLALAHIQENITLANRFVIGMTYDQFRADPKCIYAVTRALEIISEAPRRLSPALKERHSGLPWREMAAAGNIYRHDYEDVIDERVWLTVKEALPPLLEAVESELKQANC